MGQFSWNLKNGTLFLLVHLQGNVMRVYSNFISRFESNVFLKKILLFIFIVSFFRSLGKLPLGILRRQCQMVLV